VPNGCHCPVAAPTHFWKMSDSLGKLSFAEVCSFIPGYSNGSATFRLSLFIPNNSAAFTLPAGWNLTAACNGEPAPLPALGRDIVVTLHEAGLPTGAAAAADTALTITPADVEGTPVTVTVHNAKAAAVVPTPSPVARLPQTGGGMQSERAPVWLLLLALGAAAISALAWIVAIPRRRPSA